MEGSVNLQLSAKSVGVFEAFYNSLKPIPLVNYSVEIAKPGKLYHSLRLCVLLHVCLLVHVICKHVQFRLVTVVLRSVLLLTCQNLNSM